VLVQVRSLQQKLNWWGQSLLSRTMPAQIGQKRD
jgi:hypothetical protein